MTVGEMLHSLLIGPLRMLFELIFSIANRFLSPGFCIVALSFCVNILVLPLYRRADAIQAEERETGLKLIQLILDLLRGNSLLCDLF